MRCEDSGPDVGEGSASSGSGNGGDGGSNVVDGFGPICGAGGVEDSVERQASGLDLCTRCVARAARAAATTIDPLIIVDDDDDGGCERCTNVHFL